MIETRRGNALILVAGVLVLLVIIAAVFLSRTGTLREIGAAQRQTAFQQDRMESAAEEIAQEISQSLFVREIDYTDGEYALGYPVDEGRRKQLSPDAERYDVDDQFAWNRAPYEVSPWTNPPDWLTWPLRTGPAREVYEDPSVDWDPSLWTWYEQRDAEFFDLFAWDSGGQSWPNPSGNNVILSPRRNPIGGPGISDTRWLRDLEPQRMASQALWDGNASSEFTNPFSDRYLDAFSHWRHLSYIGRPQNGWRICTDIADVTGDRSFDPNPQGWQPTMTVDGIRHGEGAWVDGRRYYGGVLDRLDIPVEQWPAQLPSDSSGFGQGGGIGSRLTDPDGTDGDTGTSVFVFDNDDVTITASGASGAFPTGYNNLKWDFWDRWLAWFRPEGHRAALRHAEQGVGAIIPPNFYDLSDLDGDGVHHEIYRADTILNPDGSEPDGYDARSRWGERPEDEFRPGTARWHVSRILTDTDGDGFTDSYWWLSPHIGQDGTRQVVGVSITDNGGRFNANAATRFIANDHQGSKESTRGWTAGDLAFVGQNFGLMDAEPEYNAAFAPDMPVWNTGFMDIELHQPAVLEFGGFGQALHPDLPAGRSFLSFPNNLGGLDAQGVRIRNGDYSEVAVAWDPDFWRTTGGSYVDRGLVDQLNLRWAPVLPDADLADANDRENRLAYFQLSGQDPQDPQNIFTPFNLADELELRAYEGQQHPWVDSRLERAAGLGTDQYGDPFGTNILRSITSRTETSEAADQLDNRQLASDLRHRLTFFSGSRNETLPAHLWWEQRAPLPRGRNIDFGNYFDPPRQEPSLDNPALDEMHYRFLAQMRRKLDLREYERPTPAFPGMQAEYGPLTFSERLPQALMLALTSGDVTDRDHYDETLGRWVEGTRDSYFGKGDAAWEKTRRLAAAMAANLLASRDPDDQSPLYSMKGYHPNATTNPLNPAQGMAGEVGAMPLPIFEDPFDIDGTVFANGDAFVSPLDRDGNPVTIINDFIDQSDAVIRNPLTVPAQLPWDTHDREFEHVTTANPAATTTWTETRLMSEHASWSEAYAPEVHMLGVEPQPFIAEAFVGVVGRPWKIPEPEGGSGDGQPPGGGPPGGGGGGGDTPVFDNAGEWIWATDYDGEGYDTWLLPRVQESDGGEGAPPEWVDAPRPDPPRVVFAVQLTNPYDVPLPLLDQDGAPIYTLRFFRQNRLDPNSPVKWEIPLDPRGTANGGQLEFMAATSSGEVDLSAGVGRPMIPPATHDRPYSLMIVMNGVEQMGKPPHLPGEPYEATRWLDFLDAEASLHPSGDGYFDPGDPLRDARQIEEGELIWMIEPDASNNDDSNKSMSSLAKDWFRAVGGGVADTVFANEDFDARLGVGIELVRRHKRDWNQNGAEEQFANGLSDYTTHVVIDRTVDADGIDEFAHVVTTQLALHRQPDIRDVDGTIPTLGVGSKFPMNASIRFALDEGDPKTGDLPEGMEYEGNIVRVTESWRYPRALGFKDSEEALDDDLDGPQGVSAIPSRLRVPPDKARWFQWARYARPWAVDDVNDGVNDPNSPMLDDIELAVELDWEDGEPISSRLWRPERAAPRFVVADGRVTRSWAKPWAVRLGTMPNLHVSLAYPQTVDGSSDFPPMAFPVHAQSSGQRVLQNRTWEWEGSAFTVGPPLGGGEYLGLTMSEDPLLVSDNLPPLSAASPDYRSVSFDNPPMRLDRRWAEQKASLAPTQADPSDDAVYWSSRWVVNTIVDGERDVRVFVTGDPEQDQNLPYSNILFDADPANDYPVAPSLNDASQFIADFGAGWISTNSSLPTTSGVASEYADTYANLLRYRHGHVYHVDWDPDGLGRVDVDGDGFYADDNQLESPYSDLNPYPYAWATRNTRLPWNWDRNADVNGDGIVEAHQWRIFEGLKPIFFAFTPRKRVGDQILSTDPSYDPLNLASSPWSYPDKGYYGPEEIDGEIVMPHGFQLSMKNANFEHVGEALGAITVAHELYIPLQTQGAGGGSFPAAWYGWPTAPRLPFDGNNDGIGEFPNHPSVGSADGIATLRTFSEGLAQRLHEGNRIGRLRLSGIGRVIDPQLRGACCYIDDWDRDTFDDYVCDLMQADHCEDLGGYWYGVGTACQDNGDGNHDPCELLPAGSEPAHLVNAIVGDHAYDVTAIDPDAADPELAPPPWLVESDDRAHMEPDLPAGQRVADLFVCDGPGIWDLEHHAALYDFTPDGLIDEPGSYGRYSESFGGGGNGRPLRDARFDNAAGFKGDATRGMVNINTASAEVMRAMPHMYRLVHGDPSFGGHSSILNDNDVLNHNANRPISPNPRSAIPEAIIQYRDGLGHRPASLSDSTLDPLTTGIPAGPMYADRGNAGASGLISSDTFYSQQAGISELQTDEPITQSRGTRGFATLGELFQLNRPALYNFDLVTGFGGDAHDWRDPFGNTLSRDAFRMDWAARNPFGFQDEQVHGPASANSELVDPRDPGAQTGTTPDRWRALKNPGAFLSTDTGRHFDSQVPGLRRYEYVAEGAWGDPDLSDPLTTMSLGADPRSYEVHLTGDRVSGDHEEANLLFSGISNIISTRSDIFTVHLRVRTFRQDPETEIWDATDPDQILADERYVMVVDRSNVEHPGDRPRILLLDRVGD